MSSLLHIWTNKPTGLRLQAFTRFTFAAPRYRDVKPENILINTRNEAKPPTPTRGSVWIWEDKKSEKVDVLAPVFFAVNKTWLFRDV